MEKPIQALPRLKFRRSCQFGIGSLLVATALLSMLLAWFGWHYRKMAEYQRRSNAIEELIESLVDRRPARTTRGQWGSAVAWTLNLHGNSLSYEVDGPTIAAFEERLREKLAGDVDMQTIDWIWNEYANICPAGARYQRFKAQMLDEIDKVGPNDDVWGMNVP